MNYGFIRIAGAVPELKVADCKYNCEKILELINIAERKSVQVVCFPELCITSYTCGDLFFQQSLLENALSSLKYLMDETKNLNIVSILGLPITKDNQIFNCAVVIQKGNILGVVPKSHIPNHNEFYELRWFSSGSNIINDNITIFEKEISFGINNIFESNNFSFAIEICEDLWAPIPPSTYHCLNGAHIIFNPSASNEIIAKHEYRRHLISQQSARCISGYLYVSAGTGESTTDLVFAGDTYIYENGSMLSKSQRFLDEPQLIINEIDVEKLKYDRAKSTSYMNILKTEYFKNIEYRYNYFTTPKINISNLNRKIDPQPFVPSNDYKRSKRCEEIFSIQVSGLTKRLKHIGSNTAVVGISGGLDSTLALLVTAKTFDKLKKSRKGIIAITMPGFGTTDRTYNNALELMTSLGVTIKEISIKDACLQHFKDIEHDPEIHDVTYENTQARERTQLLMDIANKEKGIVIGTGDLSELALGWATYNGDHMSMYAVNSGVPKTLVRYLVEWVSENVVNETTQKTLLDILDTPVSPELLPADNEGNINQKTEDIVGPYELHDFFLYYMVRFGFSPHKILFLAEKAFNDKYSKHIILKWLKTYYRRFFTQQFKRSCIPDGPKVGTINLSPRGDWRMPSDASYELWLNELANGDIDT
jgi:NAD+ synthase (glutamine-hydrolysing)